MKIPSKLRKIDKSFDPEKKKFVLGPKQTRWIEALESGKYKQGHTRLYCGPYAGDGAGESYCCLGVSCKIAEYFATEWINEEIHPNPADFALFSPIGHLSDNDGFLHIDLSLTRLNDKMKLDFPNIAYILRKYPYLYFSRPV
jgi:hypothetical protein